MAGVLYFKDVMVRILSFLDGQDYFNSRLVCKDWNDAALSSFRHKAYLDITKVSFKKTTRSPSSQSVSDVRLFTAIKMDRFDTEGLKMYQETSRCCSGRLQHPKPFMTDWTTTFAGLKNKGATLFDLKFYCRSELDLQAFVTAANNKQLQNLEKLNLIVSFAKKCGKARKDNSNNLELKPHSLDKLQTLLIDTPGQSDITSESVTFMQNLINTARNLKTFETSFFSLDLSGSKSLRELNINFFDTCPAEMQDEKSALLRMLDGASDKIETLSLNCSQISEPARKAKKLRIPKFPKVKKLHTTALWGKNYIAQSFPNLETLIGASFIGECAAEGDGAEQLVKIVEEYLKTKPKRLKYLESDCFFEQSDIDTKFSNFLQLAGNTLDHSNDPGKFAVRIENDGCMDCKDTQSCWSSALNLPFPKLLLKVGGNPTLHDLVEGLAIPEVKVGEENRPDSVIEFVFAELPFEKEEDWCTTYDATANDRVPETYSNKFPTVMQKLARRWGFIKLTNLMMKQETIDEIFKAIKKHKLPVEVYSGCQEKGKPPLPCPDYLKEKYPAIMRRSVR